MKTSLKLQRHDGDCEGLFLLGMNLARGEHVPIIHDAMLGASLAPLHISTSSKHFIGTPTDMKLIYNTLLDDPDSFILIP